MSEPEPESNKTTDSIAAADLFDPFDIDVKRRMISSIDYLDNDVSEILSKYIKEEKKKRKNKEDFRRGYVFTQVQRDDLVNIIYKGILSTETRPEKEHRKIFEDMEKEYEVKFFEYINKNKPELSQEDIDDFTDGNNSKAYQSIRFNMLRKAQDILREFRHDKAEEERDLYEASIEYKAEHPVGNAMEMNTLGGGSKYGSKKRSKKSSKKRPNKRSKKNLKNRSKKSHNKHHKKKKYHRKKTIKRR